MSTITRFILAHKRLVVGFWMVITIVGVATVSSSVGALSKQFAAPGQAGFEANQQILRRYGNGGDIAPIVPVVALPAGTTVDTPSARRELVAAVGRIASVVPHARVASYVSTGDRLFVSADRRTTFALVFPALDRANPGANPDALRAAQRAARSLSVAGVPVRISGFEALQSGSSSNGTTVLVEVMVGAGGALIVLAFVFASFVALVPLVMAATSIMTTFLLLWALTTVTQVSFIVEFLVGLIGLGVAIDYALLVIVRWREERAQGADNETAVVTAMQTAGRAVVFSGTTVAIGLLALIVLPVPFLRSVGYGGMLIPLVSVLVALTLLPVALATVGPRLDWPHVRREAHASRGWTRWAVLVTRHRTLAAAGGLAIVIALVASATSIRPGEPSADALAKSGDAHTGLLALERSGIGAGALTPIETLTSAAAAHTTAQTLAAVPGVRGAIAPAAAGWQLHGSAVVDVFTVADGATSAGSDTLARVRSTVKSAPTPVLVGGPVAQGVDFTDAVYGSFPLMIALIAVVTFVLLARAFRSILLPLKAVILNVLSVGAAWGILTLIWQDGHGSHAIWGISATGAVTAWVPLMVFAFLFGLSMDYEVFILARTREEYDATGSTDQAVIRSIGRTGRLVTCAALILFLAFVSMSTTPQTDIKILATGLAAGILLDATIVRALLVPALMSLFGRWNWWLPDLPARILFVQPSRARPEPRPSPVPAPRATG